MVLVTMMKELIVDKRSSRNSLFLSEQGYTGPGLLLVSGLGFASGQTCFVYVVTWAVSLAH